MGTNDTINHDQLLNENQLAQMLGFTPRALQQWRLVGRGPRFIRISGRSVRYRYKDVMAWLDAQTRTSTSDNGIQVGGVNHA